jgi:hypothetical protein
VIDLSPVVDVSRAAVEDGHASSSSSILVLLVAIVDTPAAFASDQSATIFAVSDSSIQPHSPLER